jgi:hypothetical protein
MSFKESLASRLKGKASGSSHGYMFAEGLTDYVDLFILRELSLDCSTFYLSFSIIPAPKGEVFSYKIKHKYPKVQKREHENFSHFSANGIIDTRISNREFFKRS